MSILGIVNVRPRLRHSEGNSAKAAGFGSHGGSGVSWLERSWPPSWHHRVSRMAGGIDGWSALVKWPLIPIHGVMLDDGRVLTYGTNARGQSTGNFIYDIWDPKVGMDAASHFTLPNTVGTNLFCDAQLMLPSGKVLLAGGDIWNGKRSIHRGNSDSVLFDPATDGLTQGASMKRKRYYATVTTLPNGRTYIQGGLDGNDRPEVRRADGTFKLLTGVDTSGLYYWYPRAWVTRDGRIFGLSDLAMYYVDPAANGGAGSFKSAGSMPSTGPSGASSSEVMYAPGKIFASAGAGSATTRRRTGRARPPSSTSATRRHPSHPRRRCRCPSNGIRRRSLRMAASWSPAAASRATS